MKRNIFLALNGLETIAVGIYLLVQRNALLDDHSSRVMHMVHEMGNAQWAVILIAVGVLAMIVGLCNINRSAIQTVILIVLGGLWFAYAAFFTFSDLHFMTPFHLGTLLSWFVFIQILFEAYFGEAR